MIARAGGRVLAQSASEALFADMPNAAMRRSQVGLAFDSTSLAQVVCNLVMVPGAGCRVPGAGWRRGSGSGRPVWARRS